MGIIGWILLGLVAGVIAKAVLPGDDPGGIIVTILIGIAGAFIGGLVAKALGFGDPIDEFFDFSTWLAAIIGAVVLLLIYRMLVGRRSARGAV
ncbi:MAG: GlsB/YeaQ/YmgE family stress response membrane protein [Actinobacteria bacterium]|nr:GlsB/YeaQ/YmgE family stress response membrane protein [Actinomycetota bacterium]